ncbi:uncharacterized protein G2W53_010286 [Senna tora]|uniref:Uncharacterized protein n=1 Tax=Senna tora TaxID=362788 RepID=A0A835CDV9_9FABA|nr:uncharacterized protein G2W53_010286 [Senna tora]
MAWVERGSCLNMFWTRNRGRISETFTNYDAKDLLRKNLLELRGKTLVAQVSETRRFALYLRTRVVLMLQLESSWHERSVDNVLTYFRKQIAVKSLKLHELRGKTLVAQERGSCLNIYWTRNHGRISETFTNYEAKHLLSKSVKHVGSRCICEPSGFDSPIGVVMAWEERGSCLNIFRTRNRDQIS